MIFFLLLPCFLKKLLWLSLVTLDDFSHLRELFCHVANTFDCLALNWYLKEQRHQSYVCYRSLAGQLSQKFCESIKYLLLLHVFYRANPSPGPNEFENSLSFFLNFSSHAPEILIYCLWSFKKTFLCCFSTCSIIFVQCCSAQASCTWIKTRW